VLIVSVDECRAGMRLAAPVGHPEQPGHDLLKAGFILTQEVIIRLRDKKVTTVFVDYPDLAELDKFMAPYLSPQRQVVYRQVRDCLSTVQKSTKPTVDFTGYQTAMREMVLTLMHGGQHPIYLDLIAKQLGGGAVAHATAVAHLSLVIGIRLENYLIEQRRRLSAMHAREVVNLGVAGMLHDIGICKLSEAAQKASRVNVPVDDSVRKEWETHARIGYELVKGGLEASAAAAILNHHQNWDGSGFPAIGADEAASKAPPPPPPATPVRSGTTTLKAVQLPPQPARNAGEKIHVFARILAAANLYERLTVDDMGQPRTTLEALHLMQTKFSGCIDPTISIIMPSVVPPFPPGLKVSLSDGTLAVTVGLKTDRPYRPILRRIVDAQTYQLAPESVDLASPANTGLNITHVAGVKVDQWIPPEVEKPAKAKVA